MYSEKEFTKDWTHFCSRINFGDSAMDAESIRIMNEMPSKINNTLTVAPKLLEALKELVEACPCQNGCDKDDMACATRKAQKAIESATL